VVVGESARPSRSEFLAEVRQAFGYLADFGFLETGAQRPSSDPFEIRYSAPGRSITIRGSGWGAAVDVTLETDSGRWGYAHVLAPIAARRNSKHSGSQFDEVRRAAASLREHAADFLAGQTERFERLAGPIPPYLR